MSGFLYVVTADTLGCLYAATVTLPYFDINDVLVTGFAADRCGIKKMNTKGMDFCEFSKVQVR